MNPDAAANNKAAMKAATRLRIRCIVVDRISSSLENWEHMHRIPRLSQVDLYFALDTRNGQRTDLSHYDDLAQFASQSGNQLKLEPIYDVYSRYRFTRFEVFAGLLFTVPPIIAFITLLIWIVRLRRTRMSVASVAS